MNTGSNPLDKEVADQWQRLYLALLKKTTEHVENSPATELKPSMVSAARSLLRDNGVTKDQIERERAQRQARAGLTGLTGLPTFADEMPFNADTTPNPDFRPTGTEDKPEPTVVPFRDYEDSPAPMPPTARPRLG